MGKEVPDIRLISLDFDGTILAYDDPCGVFHSEVIATLNGLEGTGVRWCGNSGREFQDQLGVLERSHRRGLTFFPDALICLESLIYLRQGRDYSAHASWNERAMECSYACHARVQERLSLRLDYIRREYRPLQTVVAEACTAFLLRESDELTEGLHRELERVLSGIEDIMITRSGGWVSVMPSMLGKGNALLAYARHAGLSSQNILAVGDHHNDLPMLGTGAAGHVGCPADAIPEVREAVQRAGGMVAGRPGPAGTVEVLRAHLRG